MNQIATYRNIQNNLNIAIFMSNIFKYNLEKIIFELFYNNFHYLKLVV